MIAGAIAIDIAPALCSHSALLSISQITLTLLSEKSLDIALTRIRATPMMARPTRAAFHLQGSFLKFKEHFLQKLVVPTFTFYKKMTNLPILWPRGPKRLVPMR